MKLKPLGERFLVRPDTEGDKTESGIILPSGRDKEVPMTGEIVVASEAMSDSGLRAGHKIIFRAYGPEEVELNGEKLLLVDYSDIMALVK